jgi:hypothetical protein
VAAGVVTGLQVDTGAVAGQGAQDLGLEALALEVAQPGDDGQARVQVEGEAVVSGFDDDPLVPHSPEDRQHHRTA